MAYSTGTASDIDDLINVKLKAFAIANGWTVNEDNWMRESPQAMAPAALLGSQMWPLTMQSRMTSQAPLPLTTFSRARQSAHSTYTLL
jgi:hypothetical protein